MNDADFERARFNMVEQQIRPWEVLDQRVLDTLMEVPRHRFVDEEYLKVAYSDIAIPLPHGEEMMHPKIEAKLLQAVDVRPNEKVLEVGTGSGYLTALLSRLSFRVVSVELHEDLSRKAAERLAAMGADNVELRVGDGAEGWPDEAPFDVIVLTGSVARIPQSLLDQLKPGGRLFAVVGEEPVMEAKLVTRVGDREWAEESLFETVLPPLRHLEPERRFAF